MHKRLSRWFVWAHPFDAKVSEWLKQVREFCGNKALTICKVHIVIYTFCGVMSFQVF